MMKMQIVTTNSEFLRKPLQRIKLFQHSLQTMILIRVDQVWYQLLTEKMYRQGIFDNNRYSPLIIYFYDWNLI